MMELEIRQPGVAPVRKPLEGEPCVIGRSHSCDVVISEASLSRRHARVFKEGDDWMVEDLGSRNGTLLNGVPVVAPAPLASGDELRLGSAVLTLCSPTTAAGEGTGQVMSVLRPATSYLEPMAAPQADPAALERFAERMRIVNEVHSALAGPVSEDELLTLILDRVFAHLSPEHGVIVVQRGGEWVRAAERARPGAGEQFPTSQSLLDEVAVRGLAALVLDTATDERFADAASILGAGVRSLVAAPLLTPDGPLGMIALSSSLAVRRFSEHDLELLVSLASAAGLRMRNIALAEEAAERRQLAREVALARRIQEALLPAELPDVPGVELFGSNVPSRYVSGDYYQLVQVPAGGLAVLVADVSGKGIGASLLTAYLDAVALTALDGGQAPADVLAQVSRQLHRKTPTESFATAFLALLEPVTGRLRWASGGHEPVVLVDAGGEIRLLERTGLPLGLLPDAGLTGAELRLEPGDLLAVYTDGLSEATNPASEEFGRTRLAELVREHRDLPLAQLAGHLEQALEGFADGVPFHDDRTLVLLRWSPNRAEADEDPPP